MKTKYVFFFILLFATACSTNLNYAPKLLETTAKESLYSDLKRALRTQASPYNVDTVEVDQERFTTSKQVVYYNYYRYGYFYMAPMMTTVPITITVYYDKVGKLELFSKSSNFIVLVHQKNNEDNILYKLVTDDKEDAIKFIDSLHTLSIQK